MPPQIPGVELGVVVGRGGNATVYAGVQEAVRRPVAVKVETRAISSERQQRRFLREATAAGAISSHPHVVSLIDVGTTGEGHPYLVMELCERGSVGDLLKRTGALPVEDALDIAIAISGALAAAHDLDILHRDVKPANILIDDYGTPRLTDFGLAATIVPGEAFSATVEALTPAYASPEVFAQQIPTPRSDVYSMGATLYAMLVGGSPRRREDGSSYSIPELLAALPERLAPAPIPGADLVMPVIWRAMAYEPEHRYATAAELRADLIRVRGHFGPPTGHIGGPEVTIVPALSPAVPPGTGGPLPPPPDSTPATVEGNGTTPRRGRWVALAAVLGVVGGLGIAFAANALSSGGGAPTANPSTASPQEAASTSAQATAEAVASTEPSATEPTSTSTATASAAAVEGAPEVGTCWGGMVVTAGNVAAESVPCDSEHYWETYASGVLDANTESATQSVVAYDPNVLETCTEDAFTTYLGTTNLPSVRFDVIPPSEAEFLAGERGFSCVATLNDVGSTDTSLRDPS